VVPEDLFLGQIGPFFCFLGAITDCNPGFPQWHSLAETLIAHPKKLQIVEVKGVDIWVGKCRRQQQ